MASWSEFAADEPRLARAIRALIQQYGPGLGYLATVRADGGPRVHPVSPVITDEGLFCFVVDSPKRRDLERDGRYALHSFPPEESDDEAYVAGRAEPVTDPARVSRLATDLGAAPHVDWRLFEFTVDVAMLARQGQSGPVPSGGDRIGRPAVQVWLDPASASPTETVGAAGSKSSEAGSVGAVGPARVAGSVGSAKQARAAELVGATVARNQRPRHAAMALETAVPAP